MFRIVINLFLVFLTRLLGPCFSPSVSTRICIIVHIVHKLLLMFEISLWLLCLSLKVVSAKSMFFSCFRWRNKWQLLFTQFVILKTLYLGDNFPCSDNYTQTTRFWDLKCFYFFWDEITAFVFFMQLSLILTVFLLKILRRIWLVGKC